MIQACQICDVDISRSVKVICTGCKFVDKNSLPFIECLECLRKGREKNDHKHDHSYYILDRMDFPLFVNDWTAQDEMMLLKGISQSGIDNWPEISQQLGFKAPSDCEAQFYSFYYKSIEDPIPRIEDIGVLKRDKSTNQPVLNDTILTTNAELKSSFKPLTTIAHRSLKSSDDNASDNSKNKSLTPISNIRSLVGYMPKRGDFDTEYDDEAETRICEMEFNEDDTEEETKLKYKVLEYYNARLDERIRRKKFVIERGLLDLKKIQRQERKRSKEERDIINAMKPFARFSDKKEHERRVNNILKEYQLRVLIGQLKYFKAQGLSTLDEIDGFIEEQKKEGKFDEAKDEAVSSFIKKQKTYAGEGSALRPKRAYNASVEIANAPGFGQLTEEEKDLVIKIGVMPTHYKLMKNMFIKQFEANGDIKEEFITEVANETGENTNVQQSLVIYNFLAKNKSIKKADNGSEDDD
uniref:Transcriptional adapter 2 n=1 Tax=Euplotes harpa TaxID=151035 RepID=A0A7S3JP72_9SPIT|mmetsp:Transcript_9511/g.10664  ORF Transcript_9511/g.10664 Transcript_9511/m.10664 type:complete len:467 (+) Transcript_9511:209-1609(+)